MAKLKVGATIKDEKNKDMPTAKPVVDGVSFHVGRKELSVFAMVYHNEEGANDPTKTPEYCYPHVIIDGPTFDAAFGTEVAALVSAIETYIDDKKINPDDDASPVWNTKFESDEV